MNLLRACTLLLALMSLRSFAQATNEPSLLVEDVQCRGNSTTSCAYILSHLHLAVGGPVDEDEIENARFRLSALSNFTSVDIFLEKGSQRGKARIVVEVVEANAVTKEWLIGASTRVSSVSQLLAGRISHQNLFGSGEILDLVALGRIPLDGPERETAFARLQYVDPNAFGSDKYFLITGVSYVDEQFSTKFDLVNRTEQLGIDLSIGRRVWDFSYFAAGYQFLPIGKNFVQFRQRNHEFYVEDVSFSHGLFVDYGWNSEDDPYYPTQGSRFRSSLALLDLDSRYSSDADNNGETGVQANLSLGYRQTWAGHRNDYWTFKAGTSPGTEFRTILEEGQGLTITYARSLPRSDAFGGVRRGRWYIEAGFDDIHYSPNGPRFREVGLKAGVRLDTKAFGIVELFLLATTDWRSETGK